MDNEYIVDLSFNVHHSFNITAATREEAEEQAEEKFINVLSEDYIGKNFHDCFDVVELNSFANRKSDFEWEEELSFDLLLSNTQSGWSDGDSYDSCKKDSILFNFYNGNSVIFSVCCMAETSNKR